MNPTEFSNVCGLFNEYEELLNLKAVAPLAERVFTAPVEIYEQSGTGATLPSREAIVAALSKSIAEPRPDGRRIRSEISEIRFLNAGTAIAFVSYYAPVGNESDVELRKWFYLLQKKDGEPWRVRALSQCMVVPFAP